MFYSGPDPRNPPNRPGKAAPDPSDIVEQPNEIVDFRSRGVGPVGHPQGVQGKTLIFNMKYLPKASRVFVFVSKSFFLSGDLSGSRSLLLYDEAELQRGWEINKQIKQYEN